MGHPKDQLIFVGTYTNLGAKGIYTCHLNGATGQLTELSVATDSGPNPSFVTIHPNGKWLYSVSEINDFDGDDAGGVNAYSIGENGQLSLINKQSTQGTGPCHLVVEQNGKYLFVANYAGGSVAMFEVNGDGSINEACDFHQHEGGSMVEPSRQNEPHAHSVTVSPGNNQLIVCDLGLDKVLVYDIDHDGGKLVLNEGASVDSPPGGGPRHFAFHPNGENAFAINEIGLTISCYDVDQDTGGLTETHWVGTVGPDVKYEDGNSTADIHVSPRRQTHLRLEPWTRHFGDLRVGRVRPDALLHRQRVDPRQHSSKLRTRPDRYMGARRKPRFGHDPHLPPRL